VWYLEIDTEVTFKFADGTRVTADVDIDPWVYMVGIPILKIFFKKLLGRRAWGAPRGALHVSGISQVLQTVHVDYFNFSFVHQQKALFLKATKHATHGFDGESQIITDVSPRHGQAKACAG